ncbi:MAG: type II toxin-antitoxin system VapB family antitoxin [Caldilineaceae bacterium SB0675_bin_29]|uniref:Type II toxin-antitoxin system VapB family antitoxin n=1 Tax=Caldilineaceae bacterium SB0675_bin_29 TaxID=2605266 RepID=A0A6B1G2B7_9CHLR|nr:type II toxin-antitoxin system VapB family antitoxin [Caldilineaceae bacterium SB0675_bin_29]
MHITIDLDDKLIEDAMSCSGATTKREMVETALRLLVKLKSQEKVRSLRGQLRWEGDLETMRLSCAPVKAN